MPDKYSSVKVAFLHPFKMEFHILINIYCWHVYNYFCLQCVSPDRWNVYLKKIISHMRIMPMKEIILSGFNIISIFLNMKTFSGTKFFLNRLYDTYCILQIWKSVIRTNYLIYTCIVFFYNSILCRINSVVTWMYTFLSWLFIFPRASILSGLSFIFMLFVLFVFFLSYRARRILTFHT